MYFVQSRESYTLSIILSLSPSLLLSLFLSISISMARGILFPAGLIVVFLVHQTCSAVDSHYCPPSSCGNIRNIHYPFRLKSDPENCGDQRYNLSCENNQTVLYLYDGRYYVREIYYNNYTIRVVDPGILNANGSFIPRYSLVANNFSFGDPYQTRSTYSDGIIFVKCEKPLNSGYDLNISACFEDGVHFSNSSKRYNRYALFRRSAEYLEDLCQIEQVSLSSWSDRSDDDLRNISCTRIHNELLRGFELLWYRVFCGSCKYCHLDDTNSVSCSRNGLEAKRRELIDDKPAPPIRLQTYKTVGYGLFQATKMILVTPFVIAFLIFKCHRRHLSDVEEFLQSHDNLMLVRYSYSEIRKMTKNFKDQIGVGSFGTVFKGTLRSGRFVAIKLFGKFEGNGEYFINEVETLGRIRHVNVVQLIGFCVERSKRALVYEFMPNGSLRKYLSSPEVSTLLSYDKMFDIALGVAHAIEYLHQGCDMQILHFDIKPHIILLDESFNPKVSSFDLAMLHPKDNNIISLDGPRGTMGYVAPELFDENIGDISCKVDVYNFGMLLMEMASRRKIVDTLIEDSSAIYYPIWVYDQLMKKNDIKLEDVTEKEKKIVKKMIIVALWCIQMKPIDRPLMNEVVEMLKGKLERLQMPSEAFSSKHLSSKPFSSKPFFSSTEGL